MIKKRTIKQTINSWRRNMLLTALSRSLVIGLATAAIFSALPHSAMAKKKMKMASATINDVQHQWQKTFKKGVDARSGGKLEFGIFPASQLGTIPRMLEGTLLGTIESFITPMAFAVGTDSRLRVFDAPGLFENPDHLRRTIHDPAYRNHVETMLLNKGVRVLGIIYNSPFVVLTKKPAPKLSDLKGKKIRTFASPLQIEPLKALGANALPLPLSEVVPALQSGSIDGMLAGIPILTAFKFYDTAKYVTELHFSHIVSANLVNEKWFQGLSSDLKTILREEGRKAEKAVFDFGIANLGRASAGWTKNGGKILKLNDADRKKMMALFLDIGGKLLSANAGIKAEYDRLVKVANSVR